MQNRDAPEREEGLCDSELDEAILAYLGEHPHATDTLQGIAEWWVLRRLVQVEVPRVARALRGMTARGLLEQVGTGPSCLYRAAARRAGTGEATQSKP
jgi:hypothetical protein